MSNCLILYHSTDGHTIKICEYIRARLNMPAQIIELSKVDSSSLAAADIVILGASIRYGKHHRQVRQFINAERQVLKARSCAFFSVNLVARKAGKDSPATNNYLCKLLAQTNWQPRQAWVFAGKLNYPKYKFLDRQIIKFIMWLTNGPTDPNCVQEFTNWHKVAQLAATVNSWQSGA